jgi:uroporphyrinogen decarboxylase
MYYDDPRLIHDIQKTFTELWINIYTEILSEISVDCFFIWEDVSAGSGSMISPSLIREFMLPYYERLTDFLKARGIDLIIVDTDGDCFDLITLFLQGGINALMPIEVSCGMDLLKVRRHFPTLRLMGGFPKYEIKYGKQRIDQMLGPTIDTLKSGGYIPFCDHLIPPEIKWDDFRYYRTRLNNILDEQSTQPEC